MFEGLFQPMHLLVILAIVLVIFGPGKLPELGSSLGKAIKGFKHAMSEPERAPSKRGKRRHDQVASPYRNDNKNLAALAEETRKHTYHAGSQGIAFLLGIAISPLHHHARRSKWIEINR